MRVISSFVIAAVCALACGKSDSASPVACDVGNGPTPHTNTSTGDVTWLAANNPHQIPLDLTVTGIVRLEPCTRVEIGAAKTVSVSGGGQLISEGTAARPVTITRMGTANWASIRAIGGTLRLVNTRVEYGGDPLNILTPLQAALDIRGDQTLPTQGILHADNLTVASSTSVGIVLHTGGGFDATSTGVTITGSATYPINSWARAMGTIPSGTYTGNGIDEIFVPGSGGAEIIGENITVHDRGVPYHIGGHGQSGDLNVTATAAGALATMTIDPGVTMRFTPNGVFHIESAAGTTAARGALIAVGTAAKPIVFTSAVTPPAAGDWFGVYFGLVPAASNHVENVRVEYAGGASVSVGTVCNRPPTIPNAAIRIFGPPSSQFVTNTVIFSSAGHGIDRNWRSDTKIDFLPTNTFTNIAFCKQTYPADANGACPATVPCP